jgi:hypothetical protein
VAGLLLRNRCSAQVMGRSGRTGPCGLYRHLDNSIKLGYPAAKGHIEIVPKRVYNCRDRREHVENKLTLRQAAKLTGCSEAHLWRLARSGGTFEAEMLGYNWAIDRDSLLAFVREQERSGGWHGPHGPHGQGPSFFPSLHIFGTKEGKGDEAEQMVFVIERVRAILNRFTYGAICGLV